MLTHELLEEGKPIHARHLDIERYYVRYLLADALGRDKGVAGGGNHFYLRIGLEHVAQSLAHYGGVIHDQNSNLVFAHKPGLNASFSSFLLRQDLSFAAAATRRALMMCDGGESNS
jgi:hypothetical protein